jgi:two-component system, OmpR family, response regulator
MERKYKILIADDDPDILTTYGTYLGQQGFLVELAHDSQEGLEKLTGGEFDVALVDLKLPPRNGLEMIQQAHQMGVDADMIILTKRAEYDKDDAVAAIKVGVSDWFETAHLDLAKFSQRVQELAEGVSPETIARILSVVPKQELRW